MKYTDLENAKEAKCKECGSNIYEIYEGLINGCDEGLLLICQLCDATTIMRIT